MSGEGHCIIPVSTLSSPTAAFGYAVSAGFDASMFCTAPFFFLFLGIE